MPRNASILAMLCLFSFGGTVLAGGLLSKTIAGGQCSSCCATPCCCPNDYCRKPMPCVPCPVPRGCADTYCRKPMPCVPCPAPCGCGETYCPKPFPDLCRPRDWQFYRCPPPECCGKK